MAGQRRVRYTQADKERFAAQRQAELDAMHDRLVLGISDLVNGSQWQAWLKVAARFHDYSFNNTLMVFMQRPDATRVAGYKTWQALGRQVNKGETGIRIYAPVTRRATKTDRDGNPVLNANGKPVTTVQLIGVKPTSVFDISQTSGEPLAEQPRGQRLTGQAPDGLWDALTAFTHSRGYTLGRDRLPDNVDGVTRFADKTVTVRPDIDDAHATTTLIHEIGHVLLHAPDVDAQPGDLGELRCRGIGEVEAESVAYLVAAAHDLDSSSDSFAYIAGWAQAATDSHQQMHELISRTATRVLEAARTILNSTQPQPPAELTGQLERSVVAQISADRATRPRKEGTSHDAAADHSDNTSPRPDNTAAALDNTHRGTDNTDSLGDRRDVAGEVTLNQTAIAVQETLLSAFPGKPVGRPSSTARPGRSPNRPATPAGLERSPEETPWEPSTG